MKYSIRTLSFFIVLTFLGSCSVSNVNSKLVIGKWTREKTGPYTSNSQNKAQPGKTVSENQSMTDMRKDFGNPGKSGKEMLQGVMFTGISFKNDKTASVFYSDNELHKKWKMNRSGNKIVLKDSASSKKITINILSVDALHLKAKYFFPQGNLQIDYLKQN